MNSILTVSQINSYIAFKFKDDYRLRGIFVQGEISNFVNHKKTGHFYFTLKDNSSSIKAIMFSSNACNLSFIPENGMNVIAYASVQAFERDGVYQLYVTDIQPSGVGALYLAFEQLKEKLSKENIFSEENKRPIPRFPKNIGIITSKSGAALQDILNVISRRYPLVKVTLIPSLVQGADAPESISNAIIKAQKTDCDLLIVGRGGGSFEDLSSYNTELVARAIYNSTIPIISAVGHETDTTIADYVADLRAPTPSAAAELAVPDLLNLSQLIKDNNIRLGNAVLKLIENKEIHLKKLRISPNEFKTKITYNQMKLNQYKEKLNQKINQIILSKINDFEKSKTKLELINPLNVLERGFALVYDENKLVKRITQVNKGNVIKIQLSDGYVLAEIKEIKSGKGD